MSKEIKVKSLYDICQEKGIVGTENILNLIRGKKMKTIISTRGNNSGHNYSREFIVPKNATGSLSVNNTYIPIPTTVLGAIEQGKGNIYITELAFCTNTKQELAEELTQVTDSFKKQEAILKEKLELLEELGLEEYDEKIIKVVQVIDKFEIKKSSKMTKLEHAKLLVEALES